MPRMFFRTETRERPVPGCDSGAERVYECKYELVGSDGTQKVFVCFPIRKPSP
jgi:hypothetical protein